MSGRGQQKALSHHSREQPHDRALMIPWKWDKRCYPHGEKIIPRRGEKSYEADYPLVSGVKGMVA